MCVRHTVDTGYAHIDSVFRKWEVKRLVDWRFMCITTRRCTNLNDFFFLLISSLPHYSIARASCVRYIKEWHPMPAANSCNRNVEQVQREKIVFIGFQSYLGQLKFLFLRRFANKHKSGENSTIYLILFSKPTVNLLIDVNPYFVRLCVCVCVNSICFPAAASNHQNESEIEKLVYILSAFVL